MLRERFADAPDVCRVRPGSNPVPERRLPTMLEYLVRLTSASMPLAFNYGTGGAHRCKTPALPASRKSTPDTEPGLTDLSERTQARGESLYAEIARDWLDGAAAPFFERVRAFADKLSTAAKQFKIG